jgi:hypothetical protein
MAQNHTIKVDRVDTAAAANPADLFTKALHVHAPAFHRHRTCDNHGPAIPRYIYVGLRSNRDVAIAVTLLIKCVQWLQHVPYVMYAGAATFPVWLSHGSVQPVHLHHSLSSSRVFMYAQCLFSHRRPPITRGCKYVFCHRRFLNTSAVHPISSLAASSVYIRASVGINHALITTYTLFNHSSCQSMSIISS